MGFKTGMNNFRLIRSQAWYFCISCRKTYPARHVPTCIYKKAHISLSFDATAKKLASLERQRMVLSNPAIKSFQGGL